MKKESGNLWDFHDAGYWIAFTSNGVVKKNGDAVMGAGIAKQVADRYPEIPGLLGDIIGEYGNHVAVFPEYRIAAFPTKQHWRYPSDINLIKQSAEELMVMLDRYNIPSIYMVPPGTGLGGLSWDIVSRTIETILDDRVTIVFFRKEII